LCGLKSAALRRRAQTIQFAPKSITSETKFFFSVTSVPSVVNSGKDFNTEGAEFTEGRSTRHEVKDCTRSPVGRGVSTSHPSRVTRHGFL
jgi:hypothetical protein